jgi:hypothetical protein
MVWSILMMSTSDESHRKAIAASVVGRAATRSYLNRRSRTANNMRLGSDSAYLFEV